VNLQRGFRVGNGGVRVWFRRKGLENALDLRPRARSQAVAGD